jgi:dienelactone hydrolase
VIKPKWKLGKFAGQFILAFLQSSQVNGSGSFIWDDPATGRRDIAEYYAWLQGKYTIDKARVLIGGFSGGAGMAIDAAVRGVIPARGFVALCPGGVLPSRADQAVMREAAARGLAGQVVAGEKDDPEEAKAFFALLAEAGLRVGLTVVPGLGHAFPADLAARLEKAIESILDIK